jgi:hypothetical protein
MADELLMKRFLFILLALFIICMVVFGGNILESIAAILYTPVIILWDLPEMLLPVLVLVMLILALLPKKFGYNVYKYLFIFIVLGALAQNMEALFASTAFFKIKEYLNFYIYFFLFLASVGLIVYSDLKKETKWYFIVTALIFVNLLFKVVHYFW